MNKKIKITIEVELEDGLNFMDEEEKIWFWNNVLTDNGTLILHSNEIGDSIGIVTKVSNVQWLDLPGVKNENKWLNELG